MRSLEGFSLLTGEQVWDGGQPSVNAYPVDPPSVAGGRIYISTDEGIKAYGTL
ncbi:hypothetical protein KSP35_15340 [Aquihabitans sp. G128]|uniref:hypothetical protein n=1 Tax=Aquihabitans sp. G128 TaxID=2849779 RepID=UPI001C21D36E|nr:hypothetical protein [Aquihabitans sp. G128]QXC59746.1 hypothetical protein KSP35_15340 [Aquihabitans sp. G128]